MESTDIKHMKQCIELSKVAKHHGSYPVGAVVVKDDEVVADGREGEYTLPTPVAHAEIVAVLKAMEKLGTRDLSGCVLYTTKEPCFMCSYLIRQSKIRRVVFASPAGEIGGADSEFPILTSGKFAKWSPPPVVEKGLLQDEYEAIL